MDSRHDEIEDTLIGIWKEFAWYLKEVARKHDIQIEQMNKDINALTNRVNLEEQGFQTWKDQSKDRFTLSLWQVIVAFLGFAVMVGLSVWGIVK